MTDLRLLLGIVQDYWNGKYKEWRAKCSEWVQT